MNKLLLVLVSVFAISIPAWAVVDINIATQAQLENLDGVGPKKAQAIIDYRKKNGPFKSANDLDKVPGFGAKTVDHLKQEITVGNAKAAVAGTPAKVVKTAAAVKPTTKPSVPATKPAAMPPKAKK